VGLGALLITAVAALAISTLLIGSEQSRTRQQFNRAEANLAVATQQRQRADDKAHEATEKAERLRREDYAHRINLALRELDGGNIILTESLLDDCPEDLRGWEWNYVKRQAHLDLYTYRGHREDLLSAANSSGSSRRPNPFGGSAKVECLAISPDGTWAASGAGLPWGFARRTDKAEVRLWDIEAGRECRVFDSLVGVVQGVAISPDGKLVAATGGHHEPEAAGGWLKLWDAKSGKPLPLRTESVSGMVGMSIGFSPDGRFLAVGYGHYLNEDPMNDDSSASSGRLTLINLAIGEEWTPKRTTASGITGLAFCPDPDRPLLAVSGMRGVELWDWKARTFIKQSPKRDGSILRLCVAISRDGRKIASGGWDKTVRIWEPATDKEAMTLYGPKGSVLGVAFSPDAARLASVDEASSVRLWEVATGRVLANFQGHTGHVFAVAYHPDNRRILSGGVDCMVKVWDVQRSRQVIYRGHSLWVTGAAFSRNGRLVSTESDVVRVYGSELKVPDALKKFKLDRKVWDPDTGEEVRLPTAPGAESAFNSFSQTGDSTVTSPDGRLIAKAENHEGPCDVQVIDVVSGHILYTLVGHVTSIPCIAFSPDGRRIATVSHDRTIKIWDSATGQEVLTLRGHSGGIFCVAFSPDGHRLVTGSIDRTARIWDATPLAPGGLPADSSAH
jgi:WD40 repeat protein